MKVQDLESQVQTQLSAGRGGRQHAIHRALLFDLFVGMAALILRCALFGLDTTPPVVNMVTPQDSAIVGGTVTLQASATDSSGVSKVEFYVDNVFLDTGVATGNTGIYACDWNTSAQPSPSTHALYARATDIAGNIGYSDTVYVRKGSNGESDIYHGTVDLETDYYLAAPFMASVGDSLVGDAQVLNGATLSDFFWCDSANLAKFAAGDTFQSFDHLQNKNSLSVTSEVATAGTYYLTFFNGQQATRTIWIRFSLRSKS